MKTVKLFPNIRDCDLVSYEPFGHGNESTITLKAPAKINLYLDIQGTDYRGYHMLNMVNKVISLADVITVKVIKDGLGRLDFDCNKPGLPTDSRNTCVKAAGLFREYMDTTDSFSISLHKNIPHEAGLAGGSADGACVLLALNHIMERLRLLPPLIFGFRSTFRVFCTTFHEAVPRFGFRMFTFPPSAF